MPEYARVCQSMQEYAIVCQSMPEYARVCQSMPEFAKYANFANQTCQTKPNPPSKLIPFSTKVTDLFQLLAQKNCTTWLKRHPQLTICTLPLAPPSSCKTVKPDTAGQSSQHKSHTSFYLGNPPFTCQVGLASDWPPRCQTQLDKPPPPTHTHPHPAQNWQLTPTKTP